MEGIRPVTQPKTDKGMYDIFIKRNLQINFVYPFQIHQTVLNHFKLQCKRNQ